uniref:Gyrase subunit A n=1 Tax=Escherichia coli TaxID=562 RepID=I7HAR5_ECOLX|nr:gyrase subunit A [Escherichia coli]
MAAPYGRSCYKPPSHHGDGIYRLRHQRHGQIFYRLCSSHCLVRSWRKVRDGVPASGHLGHLAAHGQQ